MYPHYNFILPNRETLILICTFVCSYVRAYVRSLHTYVHMLLYMSTGFAELQSHYSVLVRSMPDDYMNTVSQLERHLTGDHIGSILECRDAFTANQRTLDCLVEQLGGEKDAFDLCNWLSIITDAPLLTAAIDDFKKGMYII